MIEQRAGRRLAALAQPQLRQRHAEIRAPDAVERARLGRHRHDAARRAGNQRQMPVDRGEIAGEAGERAKRAGIGVDQPGADAAAGGEAECRGSLRRQRAEIGAGKAGALRQAAARQHVGNADSVEEILLPALVLMREVGPFAGQRALRAGFGARRPVGKEVGKVEELAGPFPDIWQIALDPHQLRRLHLRRHDAAEIVEHAVAGGGAIVGLGQRAVVEPDDGVPALAAPCRDAELRASAVAHDQRTGRVEGDADDFGGCRAGIGQARRASPRRRLARYPPNHARHGRAAAGS